MGRVSADAKKKHLVVNKNGNDRMRFFGSCSFMQHPSAETGECIDNPPDQFYLGFPLGLGDHSTKFVNCDTPCDDK